MEKLYEKVERRVAGKLAKRPVAVQIVASLCKQAPSATKK